jgi:lipid-A-disaccharide synthase
LLESCRELEGQRPGQLNFVLAVAAETSLAEILAAIPASPSITIVQGDTYNALAAADAAIICSGTATIEAALLDVPMVVVYKVSKLTALLAKPLIRTKCFGMVNLIAEKEVAPELIQERFTSAAVAREISKLLEPSRAAQARADLCEVRRRLGPPGAVQRAAEAIVALLPAATRGSGNASRGAAILYKVLVCEISGKASGGPVAICPPFRRPVAFDSSRPISAARFASAGSIASSTWLSRGAL